MVCDNNDMDGDGKCGAELEHTRYKDVPLYFESATCHVTVEGWFCPQCDELVRIEAN